MQAYLSGTGLVRRAVVESPRSVRFPQIRLTKEGSAMPESQSVQRLRDGSKNLALENGWFEGVSLIPE